MKSFYLFVLLIILCCFSSAFADVKLANVFSDGMILQRDKPIPIWGKADADESIIVRFGSQTRKTTADKEGRWRIILNSVSANEKPTTLTVLAKNTIEIRNILVGEVWMCAGQSNMAFKLGDSTNGKEVAAQSNYPSIRVFAPAHKLATTKGQDLTGKWIAVTPETAAGITAVGFYFGRDLHERLKVPIGLIDTSWGSTTAEAWTPVEYLAAKEELRSTIEIMKVWEKERETVRAKYEQLLATWRQETEKAKAENKPLPDRPIAPDAIRPERAAGILYNSLIEPLIPFSFRGVIWYQGENNAGRAAQYRILLPTMIKAWRERFGAGDFPFGIVQLPNRWHPVSEPTDIAWSHMRDAQLNTYKSVPKTGLVVTIDVGDPVDGHPKNKKPVGERLALWALADVYNFKLTKSAPVYFSFVNKGKEIELKFKEIGTGIKTSDNGELKEFTIAGADKKWHRAKAKIVGKYKIIVWSDDVPNPVAVRYAWGGNPIEQNLTNDSGLPASPFRTDDWAETNKNSSRD